MGYCVGKRLCSWLDFASIDLVVYGSQKDYAPQFVEALENIATTCDEIKALVYFDAWDISSRKPALMHLPGARGDVGYRENLSVYSYPEVSSAGYIVPGHDHFKISSAGVAHTRSLSFLKKHLSGPYFDLEKIWEEHAFFEFGDRSVGKTMATMVKEPYVNHIPTVSIFSILFRARTDLRVDYRWYWARPLEQILPQSLHLQ